MTDEEYETWRRLYDVALAEGKTLFPGDAFDPFFAEMTRRHLANKAAFLREQIQQSLEKHKQDANH